MADSDSTLTDPSPIRLRPARHDDAAFIAECQIAMALETEDLRLDPEVVRRGVAGVFERPEQGAYWLAELPDLDRPAGCLLTLYEWSDWRNGTVLWIHSVYVAPHARRRGVFRGIYTYLKNKVEADADLKGLRLYVDRRNESACEVYTRLGMSDEHYRLFEWLK